MIARQRWTFATLLILLASLAGFDQLTAAMAEGDSRPQARKLMDDGNFKEALEQLRKLTLEPPDDNSREIAEDFRRALTCFQQL
ncbi:MAG TPA: hypothetical protein VF175_13895, partial [Lacipirellula sp.]